MTPAAPAHGSGEAHSAARTHSIERTSPKGQPFIGTCVLCGTPNLTTGDALKACPNQRGLTEDEALVQAIEGPSNE